MIMNNKMLLINRNERLWGRKSATLSPFFFGVYCVTLHTRAWLDIDIAYSSPVTGGERSVSFWRYVKAWFEADVWCASLRKEAFRASCVDCMFLYPKQVAFPDYDHFTFLKGVLLSFMHLSEWTVDVISCLLIPMIHTESFLLDTS